MKISHKTRIRPEPGNAEDARRRPVRANDGRQGGAAARVIAGRVGRT